MDLVQVPVLYLIFAGVGILLLGLVIGAAFIKPQPQAVVDRKARKAILKLDARIKRLSSNGQHAVPANPVMPVPPR